MVERSPCSVRVIAGAVMGAEMRLWVALDKLAFGIS